MIDNKRKWYSCHLLNRILWSKAYAMYLKKIYENEWEKDKGRLSRKKKKDQKATQQTRGKKWLIWCICFKYNKVSYLSFLDSTFCGACVIILILGNLFAEAISQWLCNPSTARDGWCWICFMEFPFSNE